MRAIEILRRLALVGGIVAAGVMFVCPVQALYSVTAVDFAKQQKAEFAKETESRLIEVSGPEWNKLYGETAQTLSGNSKILASHLERLFSPTRLFFAVNSKPLNELSGQLNDKQRYMYVRISQDNTEHYLGVNFLRSQDVIGHAPAWLVFPMRKNASSVLIVLLAIYLFLPWHRPVANELRYGKMQIRSVVLPDILGALLTCAFVLFPILIIPRNASVYEPWHLLDFRSGWGFLTLFMWFMALAGLSIIITALWYAIFSLFVMPDRIRRVTLFGEKEYRFLDMVAVEPAVLRWPRWFRSIALFFGLFNWRLMGTVLLGITRSAAGIKIRMRNGRSINVWMEYLWQGEKLIMALKANNIAMPKEMADAFAANAPRL